MQWVGNTYREHHVRRGFRPAPRRDTSAVHLQRVDHGLDLTLRLLFPDDALQRVDRVQ